MGQRCSSSLVFRVVFLLSLSSFCVLFAMLSVSLDSPFLIAPLGFSNVYIYIYILCKI